MAGNKVSIHVPARGTTHRGSGTDIWYSRFNPRSRKGNDNETLDDNSVLVEFQSTFPQGERPDAFTASSNITIVSIHVPARGTTAITYNFYL